MEAVGATATPGNTTGTTTGTIPGVPRDALRVEELARRAEVSVDTIRFYQKRQLLPPPQRVGRIAWYGDEHLDRLARIKDLQRQGFSLAVIRRLVAGELDAADAPLAAAVANAQHGGALQGGDIEVASLLSLDDLSLRVGVPAPLLDVIAKEGLIVPQQRDGESGYTEADADVLRAGLQLLEAGFPLPDLLALARQHHDSTRAIATDAVEMFDEHVRRPLQARDIPDAEKAELLVDAFRTLLPTVTTLVAHHFRSVLLEVAQEHLEAVGHPDELAAARNEPAWEHES
jgi:DNA-binding transcriptional MerR regulator